MRSNKYLIITQFIKVAIACAIAMAFTWILATTSTVNKVGGSVHACADWSGGA